MDRDEAIASPSASLLLRPLGDRRVDSQVGPDPALVSRRRQSTGR